MKLVLNAKKMSSDIYLKTLGNNGKIFKNVYKAGEFVSKSKLQSPVYLFNKMFKKKLYEYIQKNKSKQIFKIDISPSCYEVMVFLFATSAKSK